MVAAITHGTGQHAWVCRMRVPDQRVERRTALHRVAQNDLGELQLHVTRAKGVPAAPEMHLLAWIEAAEGGADSAIFRSPPWTKFTGTAVGAVGAAPAMLLLDRQREIRLRLSIPIPRAVAACEMSAGRGACFVFVREFAIRHSESRLRERDEIDWHGGARCRDRRGLHHRHRHRHQDAIRRGLPAARARERPT